MKKYYAHVWGCFDLLSPDGNSCLPSGSKSQAIIATLCTTPGFTRSRKWLQAIFWEDASPEKSAANLRQIIKRLKLSDIYRDGMLDIDNSSIGLDAARLAIFPRTEITSTFLEGLDIGSEAFEDWLIERRTEAQTTDNSIPVAHSLAALPMISPNISVAILPIIAGSTVDQIAGDSIVDVIAGSISQQGCADVIDLRSGLDSHIDAYAELPVAGLLLRLLRKKNEHGVSVILKQLNTGQVIWTGWYSEQFAGSWDTSLTQFQTLAAEVANAVHDRLSGHVRTTDDDSLFGSIHNVLSHSKEGQSVARYILQARVESSGVARAWLMYTYAVAHAEQHGGLGPEALEELEEHCIRAVEDSPANPIVQAIVGHINGFVFRRLAQAEKHHAIARKIGWIHPLVWTLSAMHANYTSDPERAYRFSSKAMSLSHHSPYRFFFEGPHSISCALIDRHTEALDLSISILQRRPMFLAVMRHMAASQIMLGRIDDARKTIHDIRLRDPRFISGELAGEDYPLPSPNSVRMIKKALSIAEM